MIRTAICFFMLFLLAGYVVAESPEGKSMESEFMEIASGLKQTERSFSRAAVLTRIDEFRSIQNRKAQYHELVFQFPESNSFETAVSVSVNKDFMEHGIGDVVLEEVVDMSSFDSLACSLKNQSYDCQLLKSNGDSRSIRRIYDGSERLPAVRRLKGIYRMHPYDWTIERFLELGGVKLVSIEQSASNPDISTVKCTAKISVEESPLDEEVDGAWEFDYSHSQKVITRQLFTKDADSSALLEYQYDAESALPTNSVSRFDFKFRDGKQHVIEYKMKFLDLTTSPSLPEDACYLSFYGLPELEGVNTPGMKLNLRTILLGLGACAFGFWAFLRFKNGSK